MTRRGRHRDEAHGREQPFSFRPAIQPIDILTPDALTRVEEAAFTVLETLGIEVLSDSALDLFERARAKVDRGRRLVFLDRALVRETLARAPSRVTLGSRTPARAVTFGDGSVNPTLVAGPPYVHDRERGRRRGNMADYCNLLRLAQALPQVVLIGNQPTAPTELPADTRHLDAYRANATVTDMPGALSAIGRDRAIDGITIAALARGETPEVLLESPAVYTNINVNSPRRLDGPMAEGLMAMAEWGQPVVVTPFTLMGAMAPVSLPAALAQQHAEALLGLTLAQLVRPGTPVLYGAFLSNVDMRSGSPLFGTPENFAATLATGQLARAWKLPFRASNACSSPVADAIAANESAMSVWGSVLAGACLLYHGVGWLEGGLTASFEKAVLDADMIDRVAIGLSAIEVDDASLALDAVGRIAPGGHFFGDAHTLGLFRTAFAHAPLTEARGFEAWVESGGADATERATARWKAVLAGYEVDPLPADRAEAIDAYVARRVEEIRLRGLA